MFRYAYSKLKWLLLVKGLNILCEILKINISRVLFSKINLTLYEFKLIESHYKYQTYSRERSKKGICKELVHFRLLLYTKLV